MNPRPLRPLFLSLALLISTIIFLYHVDFKHLIEPWQKKHFPSSSQGASTEKPPLKVAIVESMSWHDEVYAALVYAFGSQHNIDLSLFFANPRWGMPELLKTFNLSAPLPDYIYHNVNALDVAEPDILVITTCEYDVGNINKRLDVLFERKKTYIICTAHYTQEWEPPHDWLEPSLTKWMEAGLMTILTLSPHVQKGFYQPGSGFSNWDIWNKSLENRHPEQKIEVRNATRREVQWPPIEVFVPIFPIPEPESEDLISENREAANRKEEVAFAIQGGINGGRNYTRIIGFVDDLVHSDTSSAADTDVSLHILGSDSGVESDIFEVPASVADHIYFDKDLEYIEYYAYLSRKAALLPTFAQKDFLSIKASSSIPASVIAGIPLVATRELLGAYSYLGEGDVYLQEEGETELDVIERVVKGSREERRGKIEMVRAMRDRLLEGNVRAVEGWVKRARGKIGR